MYAKHIGAHRPGGRKAQLSTEGISGYKNIITLIFQFSEIKCYGFAFFQMSVTMQRRLRNRVFGNLKGVLPDEL